MVKQLPILEQIASRLKKEEVMSGVVITPELASELLSMNTDNRPLRSRYIRDYARQMNENKWMFNGDNIRISRTGRILDGQHRLHAVIESGKPQKFNIQLGLDDDTYGTIDVGRPRSASDVVYHLGMDSANIVASAVKTILAYKSGLIKSNWYKQRTFSNNDVSDWLQNPENRSQMESYVAKSSQLYSKKGFLLSPSQLAAFLYIFSEINENKAQEFFHKLMTFDNIEPSVDGPIIALRERFIASKFSKMEMNIMERMALTIKAWNAWVEGREVKHLHLKPGEKFPELKAA